jgi:hypothetical protein
MEDGEPSIEPQHVRAYCIRPELRGVAVYVVVEPNRPLCAAPGSRFTQRSLLLAKPQIALELLQAVAARGILPGRWVATNALYDNSPGFRDMDEHIGDSEDIGRAAGLVIPRARRRIAR